LPAAPSLQFNQTGQKRRKSNHSHINLFSNISRGPADGSRAENQSFRPIYPLSPDLGVNNGLSPSAFFSFCLVLLEGKLFRRRPSEISVPLSLMIKLYGTLPKEMTNSGKVKVDVSALETAR